MTQLEIRSNVESLARLYVLSRVKAGDELLISSLCCQSAVPSDFLCIMILTLQYNMQASYIKLLLISPEISGARQRRSVFSPIQLVGYLTKHYGNVSRDKGV